MQLVSSRSRPKRSHGSVLHGAMRVRFWLGLLALVPLLGTVGLVYGEVVRSSELRADTIAMGTVVDDLVLLGERRAHALADAASASTALPAKVDRDGDVRGVRALDQNGRLGGDDALGADIASIDIAIGQAHAELVSAATDGPRALSARAALLAAASAAMAFALTHVIGRPLKRLALGAQSLRDGSATEALKPSGPTEIREAMLAINEAAAHIKLVERQAKVLAEGRLDDEVLNERAPGALGQSLQAAVQTLTVSLSEREEFRRRLAHEATHDGLTQLANRKASLAHLEKSVARTARSGGSLAVMFIDLDYFKDINDNYGHPVGDAVLWTLGKRLGKALRAGDHVGRIGGDEFLVIAEPVQGPDEARHLAKRLETQISEPMTIGDITISMTASIGVAVTNDMNDLTATELLYDADLAVYRAKELGRSRIELCDDSLHQELNRRAVIEDALRRALANDELTMYFQPILDAESAALRGLEALIRWDRPGFGLTSPDVFIPIAERSELISDIDNFVVRYVVNQIDAWTSNPILRHIPVSINISGRHLASATFVSDIMTPVRHAQIDPALLVLEITESALLDDLDDAALKLQQLRDHSIRIAIDDFGTGYTSLGHLRSLPVDVLKIDRSFINDASASSLVKLIVDTGHLIGASITCEGIETVEQAEHFTALGSDSLQGYLFARPMPAAAIQRELNATNGHMPFLT